MAKKTTTQSPLQLAMEARRKEISALINEKKQSMQIAYINSDTFTTREMLNSDLLTINALLTNAKENYALDGRKLSPTFGYGTIPNLLITLAKAILYAKSHEKDELLFMANTTIDTIETLVDALGQESYFNPKTGMMRDEVPMDISTVIAMLEQLITDLNLVSNISLAKFNEEFINKLFERARVKAELAYENHINYINDIEDITYED